MNHKAISWFLNERRQLQKYLWCPPTQKVLKRKFEYQKHSKIESALLMLKIKSF